MSSNPGSRNQARREPLDVDPTGQDPAATDPAADEKLQLQLAIFEVTRDAEGKGLDEIRVLLLSEFSRRGIKAPPGTWVESVASSAFYGEPYIVDLPAAVAADAIVPAPNEEVRERLAARRELREEQLPPGIFPAPSDWELSPDEVTTVRQASPRRGAFRALAPTPGASRGLLAVAALAAAILMAAAAVRASRRPAGSRRTN
ncbi:hypothetical protein ACFFGR_06740 [Arthrobacter liuii]|uniref:Uncharacterized protein n=1 Tax=Arthrobacter liuii TaxID=1476996 RepID=A0ABQ2AMM0_9MICC|nr:hypothetical protein [Arthrobacter liuii]GGH92772.1 hypothetical protein GCM10007170_12090 [Arthrobacter liuii]